MPGLAPVGWSAPHKLAVVNGAIVNRRAGPDDLDPLTRAVLARHGATSAPAA
ncbi:MAG TPA: hypothetical protein VND19_13810 [Acetobacteraceae bacterium]|nr:hypothetical protein [Acetobacteraceae bacterium]